MNAYLKRIFCKTLKRLMVKISEMQFLFWLCTPILGCGKSVHVHDVASLFMCNMHIIECYSVRRFVHRKDIRNFFHERLKYQKTDSVPGKPLICSSGQRAETYHDYGLWITFSKLCVILRRMFSLTWSHTEVTWVLYFDLC